MGGMYPAMRMILVSNHGADAYAYMTEDAGKTWKPYEIDTFKKCNYVNGISIEKMQTVPGISYCKSLQMMVWVP